MQKLDACAECGGFSPEGAACPHCGAAPSRLPPAVSRLGSRLLQVAIGSSLAMTLMACYGAPHAYMQEPADPTSDLDGDGFPAREDCDDHSASIHPGAADEVGDGIDSDCDGTDRPKPKEFAEPPSEDKPPLEVATPPAE
ncbi:MAG: putative metal-binding motif-containing protein [Polyangiaceae bacterium]|nr:putative metal-binding motif-containing protein [Myxococcales bacterium]MCB9588046.1 putative metal-binding motif-containing protein [Polyangiaceae bacterium]